MDSHLKTVVIIGAGGFGREVLQYAKDVGGFVVRGFLDDRHESELNLTELALLGSIKDYVPRPGESFLLAIGDPTARARIAKRFLQAGAHFETIVHPLAYTASSAAVGPGCIVAPFATLGAHSTLSAFGQLHFYASVAHDAVIGMFSALSPYSVVNGGGRLGEGVFLGTRSTINPKVEVGSYSKVAAGAVVYRNVSDRCIAAGNPAKSRRLMLPIDGAAKDPPVYV